MSRASTKSAIRHNCEKLKGLFSFTTTNSTMPEMTISNKRPSKKSTAGTWDWFPENRLTRNAVTKLNAAMVTATFHSPRMLWESKRMTAFSALAFSMPLSATRHIHTEAMGSSMANTHWTSKGTKCVSAFSVDPPMLASSR